MEISVRLKQVEPPNDHVKTYTIPALAPGQTVKFAIDFDWFNFQVIGKANVPIGVAKVTAYNL